MTQYLVSRSQRIRIWGIVACLISIVVLIVLIILMPTIDNIVIASILILASAGSILFNLYAWIKIRQLQKAQ